MLERSHFFSLHSSRAKIQMNGGEKTNFLDRKW